MDAISSDAPSIRRSGWGENYGCEHKACYAVSLLDGDEFSAFMCACCLLRGRTLLGILMTIGGTVRVRDIKLHENWTANTMRWFFGVQGAFDA